MRRGAGLSTAPPQDTNTNTVFRFRSCCAGNRSQGCWERSRIEGGTGMWHGGLTQARVGFLSGVNSGPCLGDLRPDARETLPCPSCSLPRPSLASVKEDAGWVPHRRSVGTPSRLGPLCPNPFPELPVSPFLCDRAHRPSHVHTVWRQTWKRVGTQGPPWPCKGESCRRGRRRGS